MQMKAVQKTMIKADGLPLTPTQKTALSYLYKHRDGSVRPYANPSGARMIRLVDARINPVHNIPRDAWDSMIKEGVIWMEDGGKFTINEAWL
jgi:hypothetical protein